MLIGAFANAAFPPFAGFFSKDLIIEAAHLAKVPGGTFAWLCVLACAFVTAFYSFRLVFYAFHGEERFRQPAPHGHGDHAHGTTATTTMGTTTMGTATTRTSRRGS